MEFPDLDPRLHADLFRVTHRVRLLKTNPQSITAHQYKNILADLCGALNVSLENGFEDAVRYAASYRNDESVLKEAQEIVSNFNHFARFIEFEREVLGQCGVSIEVAEDIRLIVTELREANILDQYDPDEVMASVVSFRDATCEAAQQAETFIAGEEQLANDKKRALMTYGTALVVANATGVALTLGKAAPLLFISSGFGSVMIAWKSEIPDRFERKR